MTNLENPKLPVLGIYSTTSYLNTTCVHWPTHCTRTRKKNWVVQTWKLNNFFFNFSRWQDSNSRTPESSWKNHACRRTMLQKVGRRTSNTTLSTFRYLVPIYYSLSKFLRSYFSKLRLSFKTHCFACYIR